MGSLNTHNFHILMVDDDPDDSIFFTYAMAALPPDYRLSLQNDSSKLTEVLERETPNIIFLDLNMPSKDGKACLKEIRARKEFDEIPVVIYSTSSNKNEINECLKNGANSYVVKPASINGITKMIEEVCNDNWIHAHLAAPQKDFVLKFD